MRQSWYEYAVTLNVKTYNMKVICISQAEPNPEYKGSLTESPIIGNIYTVIDVIKGYYHCTPIIAYELEELNDGFTIFDSRIFAEISDLDETEIHKEYIEEVVSKQQPVLCLK